MAQRLKLEGLLGGDDQTKEDAHDDTSNNKEEHINHDHESYVISVQSEKKRKPGPREQVQKVEGISLNTSQSELSELDEKLIEHVEKLTDKTFRCKMCGNTAKNLAHIKNHIETHIEGLSFPCQICSKTFRSRNSMNSHKSQNHK